MKLILQIIMILIVLNFSISAENKRRNEEMLSAFKLDDDCPICNDEVFPVCASNGKIYDNPCLWSCANLHLREKGITQLTLMKMAYCKK